MDNLAIFQHAAAVLDKAESVALVTVVSVTGSSPGKVGYKMLVFDEGRRTAGTVGGGLTEARMIEEARSMLGSPASRLFRFDLAGTPDEEKGICGGTVELLVEVFDKASLPLLRELSVAADDGPGAVLVSIVAPDGLPRKLYLKKVEQFDVAGTGNSREIATAIQEAAISGRTMARISVGGMDVFIEPLALQPTVILFGAGHVSYDIARFAQAVHFRVVVCDDRAEYANRERFPDADEIVVEDPSRVFEKIRIDDRSYVVIVTRGHQHDFVVLEQALRTDARYIGMIGSRRKILTLFEKLREKGVPEVLLERVYSPIGVSIGAVTAQEIALSIVCELVKIRRLGDEAGVGHMTLSPAQGCDMINAIVLAAGESRRMGMPKSLLRFGATTFLEQIIGVLRQPDVDRITVVLGSQVERIRASADLSGVDVVINESYRDGQLSSLIVGLSSIVGLCRGHSARDSKAGCLRHDAGRMPATREAILLCLVDNPFITVDVVDSVIKAFRRTRKSIVVPVFNGRRGHPTLFAQPVFDELLNAPANEGARHVVNADRTRVLEVEVAEGAILARIDTPEDYVSHFGVAPQVREER